MRVNSYRDLQVWQKSIELVVECYRATAVFPKAETYGLSSQLQKAAVSVPANIAEGHGRRYTKPYLNHLSISYGSLMETETHLIIAERLHYIDEHTLQRLLQQSAEIGRMTNGLIDSLERRLNAPEPPPDP